MTRFRKVVTVLVVPCLINVGFAQQAQGRTAVDRSEEFRRKVQQLGSGAELRIGLKNGREFRGIVESFDDSGFRVQPRGDKVWERVPYADLTSLALTMSGYSAKGFPDPVVVRRVAVELGVGRKVRLQTQGGEKLNGRIARLDREQLFISVNVQGEEPMSVPYAQIRELRAGMSGARKALVIGAVVCGVVFLLTVVSLAVNPPG